MNRLPGLVGLYFFKAISSLSLHQSEANGQTRQSENASAFSDLCSLEDLDRLALAELDDRLLPPGLGALDHRPTLRLGLHLEDVDVLHLDAEQLLDRLTNLRLVGVGMHLERVLAVGDQAVALLRDHRREQDLVRMKTHDARPWTTGSAASLTTSERAQTTSATSSSAGTVTTTRARLRNDFRTASSSSVAT